MHEVHAPNRGQVAVLDPRLSQVKRNLIIPEEKRLTSWYLLMGKSKEITGGCVLYSTLWVRKPFKV